MQLETISILFVVTIYMRNGRTSKSTNAFNLHIAMKKVSGNGNAKHAEYHDIVGTRSSW